MGAGDPLILEPLLNDTGLADAEAEEDDGFSSFFLRLTGVLRGDFAGVVLLDFSFLEFVRVRPPPPPPLPPLAVAEEEVEEAGDIERSSFDLSLPRGLRPLLLLREVEVLRFEANQSSS